MKRSLMVLLAGASLVGPATAIAQQGGMGANKMDEKQMGAEKSAAGAKPDESKKHVSEIDLYLRDAMNNTKVLYTTTQLTPGKLDATIEREDLGNIDRAISSALTHVSHVKSMPEARVSDTAKVDSLQKNLTQARNLLGQIRTAVKSDSRDQVASLSSQLYARLKDADDDLSSIADKINLTRVDRITIPERQPVGGHEDTGATPQQQPQEQQPAQPKSNY